MTYIGKIMSSLEKIWWEAVWIEEKAGVFFYGILL